jgi:hypothetical protein
MPDRAMKCDWQKVLIRNVWYSFHGRRSTSTDDDLGDSVASRATAATRSVTSPYVRGVARRLVRSSVVAQVYEQRDVEAQRL